MGLSDRDYYGEEPRGAWFGGSGQSMVVTLILINAVVWIADMLSDGKLSGIFALRGDLFFKPWEAYQLVTYGFLHDLKAPGHIIFNMLGLWFFGSEIEGIYGRTEFLRIYLTSIVVAGLVWAGFAAASGGGGPLVGASGGVVAVLMLFVLHFPRRLIYIWGIFPLPAWLLGSLYIFLDVTGFVSNSDNVAHVAHLAGAAFAFVYFRTGWNLGRLVPSRLGWPKFKPRLRIHDPETETRSLNEQVDEILEKIHRSGEASLTKQERRTLERASRRYQQRRH